ncbi:MAG: biopolymer transporter ExbD [Gemmatimonadota bacterium]
MTPLIDVMMCLLVIFMITTPVITYYGARVPRAANPQRAGVDDALSVGIRADGTIFIGEDTVLASELPGRLRALYDVRPGDHLLYLWADSELKYDEVLHVIDAAQRAGVRTVGATFAPRPRKVLFVKGDGGVAFERVVNAVDIARGAGIEVVGLVPRESAGVMTSNGTSAK